MKLRSIIKTFILLTVFVSGGFSCFAQLYVAGSVSVPNSKLANIAGTGFSLGLNYDRLFGNRFKAKVATSFIHFNGQHYPQFGVPLGQPVSLDYKVSMLPIQFGAKFFPFSKFLGGKFFLGGCTGVQAIFFESDYFGYQETVFYKSQELDFIYAPAIGFDLGGVCFEYEKQFIASHGNQYVKSVSFSSFKVQIRIFKKR